MARSATPHARQQRALRTGSGRVARLVYRLVRALIRTVGFRWFRLRHRGAEHLDIPGPVIVAPVHRSNLDAPLVASLGSRRMRALAKDSLFAVGPVAWFMAALGAFPVRRGEADREAMRAARALLDAGEELIVFPEGTRQSGPRVTGVFDGTAYLAAKTGAVVVPVGVAGTEEAMPPGARLPRRRPVAIVVGAPLDPPAGRVTRPALRAFSEQVSARLQEVFDEARALVGETA
ncbi:MAG: 1-acyl-sn-glycerol-3-phosphate acyltransferase [Actinomyces sp.]|nr:MAG: 1-acyl-sn-glycerol-3-phosphate acyltransferase [Actinomyces sp.]